MNIDELKRQLTAMADEVHDTETGGRLRGVKKRVKFERRRRVAAAGAAAAAVVAVAGFAVPRLLAASAPLQPAGQSTYTMTRTATTATGSTAISPTSGPTGWTAAADWRASRASLRRDMPKALGCKVLRGTTSMCNGSVQGKEAMVDWSAPSGVVFGDPAYSGQSYGPVPGTLGVAYPSEVWTAIAPYLVASPTAGEVTAWLQRHNHGGTVIDGLQVKIDGPVASVGINPTRIPPATLPTDDPATLNTWRATMASLRSDMPKALTCAVSATQTTWYCNGTAFGKAALVFWSDRYGIAFGDPASHGDTPAAGAVGVAYPSEVWRAISPFLVSAQTADDITRWLRNHNSATARIDGLVVRIRGPVAAVTLPGVKRSLI